MCGIAGFVGSGELATLRAMTDAIRHRGPDAEGHWHDPSSRVFLGYRRLAIVDLPGGPQPMRPAQCAKCGPDNLTIVFNGEIYNHLDLRAELQANGHVFSSDHSDTEVLLHAYAEWGESFVDRLNGMWAFVIYDRPKQSLFGSRDRFGKKPFYYFHEGDTFGFASETPSLLRHPHAPRSLSSLSLRKYFAYCYIPAPRSIYERVWKLPGGCSLTFDVARARLTTRRNWQFEFAPDQRVEKPSAQAMILPQSATRPHFGWPENLVNEWCEQLRESLERAVQRRLMSDVPLGVFLSGGIDSSAVTAFAARHVGAGDLNTFSIGFNEPTFDESRHARTVANHIGTRHHEEALDLDKSTELIPDLIRALDEPLGDGSLLPTYLLARFTRQHVTVALGGDGGDELFAGYDPFRALRLAEKYARWVPRPVHAAVRAIAGLLPVSHKNISFDFKVKRTLTGLSYPPRLWNPVWMASLDPRELDALFGETMDLETVYSEAIESWDRCSGCDLVDRASQFWINLYLQDGVLAKVDRASMLCSLEARSPFLDIDFVNLARRIPHQLRLRGGETKWILKRALEPLLPKEIIYRSKKGFGMPIGRWLRESRFHFDKKEAPPGLDWRFVERKLSRHRANQSDERLFLWSYWLLTQWLKR